MSESPDEVVLMYLRRIEERLDRYLEEARELTVRPSTAASALGANRRIDRIETRLDRIERRLDLVELPH